MPPPRCLWLTWSRIGGCWVAGRLGCRRAAQIRRSGDGVGALLLAIAQAPQSKRQPTAPRGCLPAPPWVPGPAWGQLCSAIKGWKQEDGDNSLAADKGAVRRPGPRSPRVSAPAGVPVCLPHNPLPKGGGGRGIRRGQGASPSSLSLLWGLGGSFLLHPRLPSPGAVVSLEVGFPPCGSRGGEGSLAWVSPPQPGSARAQTAPRMQ